MAESLETIAFLLQATTGRSGLPCQSPSSHLLSVVHHRLVALGALQTAVRTLAARRDGLTTLVGMLRDAVEAAVAVADTDKSGVRRAAQARAQDAFVQAYTAAVEVCEAAWNRASRDMDRWELGPPTSSLPSSAPAADPAAYAQPATWVTSLDRDSEAAVRELLVLLVSDPHTLGAGIATLDLPTDLTSPACHGRSSPPSPLETLLHLIAATAGPDGVLALALGAWETAVREIIGREQSTSTQGDPELKGSGKGTGGAREKELEAFLVAMLDALDALGLEVEVGPATSGTSTSDAASPGPLSLHRGTESVLLKLLHDARALQPPSQTPPLGLRSTPPSHSASAFSPSSWGSTVTSSVTSTFSTLNAGLYNVASIGSSVASAGLAPFGYLPSSPNPGGNTTPPIPPSPPLTARSRSAASTSSSGPSSPSQIRAEGGPVPSPWTHRSFLVTRTVTSLLQLLTPSSRATRRRVPLVEALISQLLQSSFPLASGDGGAGHRKVLLLGVVRWWAFGWFGKKIGRAAAGGAYTSSPIPFGTRLSTGPDESTPLPDSSAKAATALLDEVYVSGGDSLDLLLAIHKTLYGALVAASGFGGGEEWAARREDGEREKRALAAAAKGLVRSWGGRPIEASGSKPASQTGPAVSDAAKPAARASLSAAVLSASEFVALWTSFSPLVLRSPAAGPSTAAGWAFGTAVPPTFKRAFSNASSADSTSNPHTLPRSRTPSDSPSLGERLEIAVGQLTSTTAAAAVFFTRRDEQGKISVTSMLMGGGKLDEQNDSTFSLDPTSLPFRRPSSTPSRADCADASGWTSPPRSPRQEALQSSIQSHGSYLSDRSVSPTPPLPPATSPQGVQPAAPSPSLSWRPGKNGSPRPIPPPPSPPTITPPTPAEIDIVRKGVFALLRGGHSYPRSDSSPSGVAIVDAFDSAVQRAAIAHDWIDNATFSQTSVVLKRHLGASPDLSPFLQRIAAPLRALHQQVERMFRLARRHLEEIETQRRRLLDLARAERGAVDDLRIRAFYSSIKGSELGEQLATRLNDVRWTRTPEEQDAARRKVREWATELGVFSFTKAESGFEESLMLVEVATTLALQPPTFYSSPFWKREEQVMSSLIDRAQKRTTSTFAETLLGAGTSILTAPLSLAALPFQSSTPAPAEAAAPAVPHVILSFGAASPAFLRPNEGTRAYVSALEEHLTRVGLKITALMLSDVAASTIANRDIDGRLLGCDAWIEEFASPLSPLARPSSAEVKAGASTLPKAFHSTTPALSHPSFRDLLDRFTIHPSPHAKVLALFELELVLASVMATTSAAPPTSPLIEAPLSPRTGKKYLDKLTKLLSNRMSLAPSAIALLLEAEEAAEDAPGHAKDASSQLSTAESFEPPSRRRQTSTRSVMSDLAIDEPGPPHPVLALAHESPSSPNTDDILLAFEGILRRVRPALLFQNLQIVASLVPSSVLDSTSRGKAFWDAALAALSVKRDLVDGKYGVVERALAALGEGTAEGRELAERLVLIGAREESSVALGLLGSLGLSL